MEVTDNNFLRQFETKVNGGLAIIEYSTQDRKIFLTKIMNIYYSDMEKNTENVEEYSTKANNDIINDVYTSYDLSLNSKYKVKIFNQTIDRVKNYFR